MIKEKSKIWSKSSVLLGQVFAKYSPLPVVFYTISSLVLAFFAALSAYLHYYHWSIILFMIAGFFDLVDGAVARAQNKASHLGAFLDGTVDRFVDFAIIFSFFFFKIEVSWLSLGQWICIASYVVILPSFIVAYANHRGAVNDDNETLIWRLMNRGEMFFLMMSVLIVSLVSPKIAGDLLILLICLSCITIFQTIIFTIYHARKLVRKKASQ